MHDDIPATLDQRPPSSGQVMQMSQVAPARSPSYGLAGRYGGEIGGVPTADRRFVLLEYWQIIKKRKWLLLGIVAASLALGLLQTLSQTPLYTSIVRLQIDRNVSKVVESGNINQNEGSDFEFMRTQIELLQSRAMAQRVASMLKLGDDSDFITPGGSSVMQLLRRALRSGSSTNQAAPDQMAREKSASGVVGANRAVRPIGGSRLVDVLYSDPSPVRAQRIAAAYAEGYIASQLDKRFEANTYAKSFLDDQIKQLKLRLEESETALLGFAEKEQIIVVNEKSSIAENNLAAANAALGTLIAERIRNEQLSKQVEASSGIDIPQLLTNGVIDGLRTRRNALVSDYKEKLETFKPSYPAMLEITSKIKEIDRQLAVEVKTIKSSLRAAFEASANQEAETKLRIETLRYEVLDLQKRSIQYNILKREVDTNRGLYNGLLQRYKEVDIAGGVGANNIFVVDRAEVPGSPSSPVLSRSLLIALAFGLAAGLAAAFVLERLDDTMHSLEDVERVLGLSILGVIPKIGATSSLETEMADPRSSLSEAYRSLCTALQFSTDSGLPKTMLITSTGPSEGKSLTAVTVARHFATMGLKVLIVDADLRKPSLHIKLKRDNAIGLSNYLTGACTPPETFQATDVPNLAFMASGPLPPNAADLLGSARLHSLLAGGLEVFDLIVLDGPPVLGLADVPLLANAAAATIFVVAAGEARTGHARTAIARLQLGRIPLIGTVLTKYDASIAGYGYGYGYGYGESYGDTGKDGKKVAATAAAPIRLEPS